MHEGLYIDGTVEILGFDTISDFISYMLIVIIFSTVQVNSTFSAANIVIGNGLPTQNGTQNSSIIPNAGQVYLNTGGVIRVTNSVEVTFDSTLQVTASAATIYGVVQNNGYVNVADNRALNISMSTNEIRTT